LDASIDADAWQADGTFDRHVERNNVLYPHQPISTRSATIPLWVNDQYDKDLAIWEDKARRHLSKGCDNGS
jgi:hypothetical protein